MRAENISALYSEYIINGVPTGITPAQMLMECMPDTSDKDIRTDTFSQIIDETVDPTPCHTQYDPLLTDKYLEKIYPMRERNSVRTPDYPEASVRKEIAGSLIEAIWKKGHFGIDNIQIDAQWNWDTDRIGNMAKFFLSVEAASQYMYDLGISLRKYGFSKTDKGCQCKFTISGVKDTALSYDELDSTAEYPVPDNDSQDNLPASDQQQLFRIQQERKCPDKMTGDQSSWLIYIPFDTCQYRLGDSLLTDIFGNRAETAPEIQDPDYFMDCYEVVREFVEDGVLLSGATVGKGGLLCAVKSLCGDFGTDIDISGIETAYAENDIVRILFGETPGVIIQIADADYDYADSQFLLQDLAYYPLGHPTTQHKDIIIKHGQRPDVSDILASLLKGQSSEGED